ncbi:hypothetical protein [Persicirhabdus sediminis]|uniref:hypothetical protein n=1 Tax=Persicirhabdus sediminis TaxID=454144 RepID=UPI001F26A438|nr:hypothetical protein [Persicirhabdus sediminis]
MSLEAPASVQMELAPAALASWKDSGKTRFCEGVIMINPFIYKESSVRHRKNAVHYLKANSSWIWFQLAG